MDLIELSENIKKISSALDGLSVFENKLIAKIDDRLNLIVYTLPQAAKICGLSEAHLRKACKDGRLESINSENERNLLIRHTSLQKYVSPKKHDNN